MKKIMFNDKYGLTQAVLEGRKTQTRRIAYDFRKHVGQKVDKCVLLQNNNITYMDGEIQVLDELLKPLYKIGEEVAVAQAYKDIPSISDTNFVDIDWVRATKNKPFGKWGCANKLPGWNNKMFVRADLMPYRIKITNIRVERLQNISEEDCLKEGIKRKNERYVIENEKGVCFYTNDVRLAFRYLIDKTCGKGTWDSNPWMFVYDFELIKEQTEKSE